MASSPQNPRDERDDLFIPDGYDTIYPRLKEVRKRALKTMHRRGGEATSTTLRADDGARVPEGSFEMHMKWLQGLDRQGEPMHWWPDGEITLAEVVRREDGEGRFETRVYGLTDYGESFVQAMVDMEDMNRSMDPHKMRRDLDDQSARIDSLVNEMNKVDTNEKKIDLIIERVGELEDKLADH